MKLKSFWVEMGNHFIYPYRTLSSCSSTVPHHPSYLRTRTALHYLYNHPTRRLKLCCTAATVIFSHHIEINRFLQHRPTGSWSYCTTSLKFWYNTPHHLSLHRAILVFKIELQTYIEIVHNRTSPRRWSCAAAPHRCVDQL